MLGLLYKANDEFTAEVGNKDDLSYTNKVIDQYKRIDVGGMAGIGYASDFLNGMNIGLSFLNAIQDPGLINSIFSRK
jgi:hypothetical protein